MPWVKLSDDFTENPKVDELSDAAFRLFVAGLCYCARHLTDGRIPAARVHRLVPRYKPAQADELLDVGLWKPALDGGYEVHDYLDWNPPAEKERAKRRSRSEAGRVGGVRSGEARRRARDEANASAEGWPSGRTPSRPVPSRVDPSSSSSTRDTAADDDDELFVDRRPLDAARILAERALGARPEHLPSVGVVSRWLRATAADRAEQHSERVAELLGATPELSALELADLLEPDLAPPKTSPFDPECPACSGVTYIADDAGAHPCPRCRPEERP